MRVKIVYTILKESDGEQSAPLEDVLQWPDVETLEEVEEHARVYLEQKYGQGVVTTFRVEEQ